MPTPRLLLISALRLMLLCLLPVCGFAQAKPAKVTELPEYVYIPPSPDKYVWERVARVRKRILFHNAVACTDGAVYSFGGYDTLRVQREMNRLEGGRLVRDSIRYPGEGFKSNIFFIRDSLMYIGGGHDSGASRYTSTDFWRYDMRSRAWTQLRDLPFRYGQRPPVVFEESGKAIVLVAALHGVDLQQASPRIYSYDPSSDSWMRLSKELPPGMILPENGQVIRSTLYPVAFRIGNDIFVLFQEAYGLWATGSRNSFLKFSMQEGEWAKLPAFPGKLMSYAFAVSDGNYGYIGGGRANSFMNRREVYRYDPVLEKWEQITSLPQGVRYAIGWRFRGETYVGFGINDKLGTVTVWKLKQKD